MSDSARIEARGHLDRLTKQPAFVKVEATVDGRVVAGAVHSSRSSASGRLERSPAIARRLLLRAGRAVECLTDDHPECF